MQILRVVARLLDYPTPELADALPEVAAWVAQQKLPGEVTERLIDFVQHCQQLPLLDWQETHDFIFDRGRRSSLHLYEHLHGDCRDRGGAMVELMQRYQAAGLELSRRELPDYLPLYLEFASTQDELATDWLQDTVPVVAVLAARLEQSESGYAGLMKALLILADARCDIEEIRQQVSSEAPDNTPEALDKVWEEEMVSFGEGAAMDSCSVVQRPKHTVADPVRWVQPDKQPLGSNV